MNENKKGHSKGGLRSGERWWNEIMGDKNMRLTGFFLTVALLVVVGQVAQAARRLAMGWMARVRSWVSEGWRFFFTSLLSDWS